MKVKWQQVERLNGEDVMKEYIVDIKDDTLAHAKKINGKDNYKKHYVTNEEMMFI